MKPSQYIFTFPFGAQRHLLYNSRTNALIKVSGKLFPLVQSLLDNGLEKPGSKSRTARIEKELIRGGFLIPDGLDEIKELKIIEKANRFANNKLGLTICTTLNCNMSCYYCYQKKKSSPMGATNRQRLVQFVSNYADHIKGLNIVWFGGEPLLAKQVIFDLTEAFEKLCEEKSLHYRAGMISNGYLLSREVAKKLKEKQVASVQLTIDGPQKIHDARRPLKNGKPTYEKIINNLQEIVDIFDKVSVRVNIDKNNYLHADELLDDLERLGLKNKVNVYFGHVDATTDACRDNVHNCFHTPDFAEVQIDLSLRALRKKYRISDYPEGGKGCCAVCLNSFVVDPQGNLFKCYNTTGVPGESVGDLKTGPDDVALSKWLGYDPFADAECLACKFLPLCLGECPYSRIRNNRKECPAARFNIEPLIKLEYLSSLVFRQPN